MRHAPGLRAGLPRLLLDLHHRQERGAGGLLPRPRRREFEASSVQGLVKQRKCPAYLVPSKPFLGRCVPTFGLARANNVTTRQVERMQTSDGSNVDSDNLKKGIEYIMKAIDAKGRLERLMADLATNWWMLVLGLLFAMLVSLGWILLLRLACKVVLQKVPSEANPKVRNHGEGPY